MERIWQWAWDRCGPRYSWAFLAISLVVLLPTYLLSSCFVVAVEGSTRYLEAGAITLVATVVLVHVMILPGVGSGRVVERWAAGEAVDDATALDATYTWVRGVVARSVIAGFVGAGLLAAVVGVTAGGTGWRMIQYAILGAAVGTAVALIGVHSFAEAALRSSRAAIAGDTAIGDSLPRSRPSFAAWTNVSMLAAMFAFAVGGAMLAAIIDRVRDAPVLAGVIACALTVFFAVPTTIGAVFAPSLRPIRDLAQGTKRVAAGDYSQRLPVVQDDDLGALAASFNRMQAGLAERQRLQGAFGTYVDPALASRLLEQGDDVFTGERREVTVMFVDIRDFTPFAESNSAEDAVARLNALFDIVVPAVVDEGGHVNKFLGDGALAVFGAPNELADHADAAVRAALVIQRLVAERFAGELRIGIGINTGFVIAGTIGGGSKLEFTLIGDTVNVAARVEQLTKTTGDTILLTQQTVDALAARPAGLVDRGAHALKGKAAAAQIFGLDDAAIRADDR
ncbi:adenylate/guanylate cyclase domain-containing protein [Mycobacterium sp. ITM-2016-00318]|uniref:adenylate/guanylate cyclase domain-containing protein n=1 Tax=Mycobacterium sp. ITM-2016-00318 TaxID=2099693 RepID=UPI00287FAE42|nr:adenylate/guanylate cyclase domain-containing protein [Mycobacterium sp. ITM-2016-00318]WNG94366.1 adenylate/guanylate cyclase domain-containing protein [Mycobacterium sp. ITM-2016-00318]